MNFKLRFAVIFGIGVMAMFYGPLVFAGEIIPCQGRRLFECLE
jgi:hypothetical protein